MTDVIRSGAAEPVPSKETPTRPSSGTRLTDDDVLERFASLRQYQANGKRAPHKPLLVLTALGRILDSGTSATPFSAVENQLASLISAFGPPSRTAAASSAAYPFTRLRSDGIWTLDQDVPMDDVTPLRRRAVTGAFTAEIESALTSSPALVLRLARMLVDSQFPETLASDVLIQAGLDPELVLRSADVLAFDVPARRRSPAWVAQILMGWDRQCAFCGYDGQLGGSAVGIEAAHVRWFNLEGPDDLDNGLALCSLHHKLFDRGALGIDVSCCVKVSDQFSGRTPSGRAVYELHGRELRPRPGTPIPGEQHVDWHNREVFKGAPLTA